MGRIGLTLATAVLSGIAGSACAAEPIVGTPVEIQGAVYELADISAVASVDGLLVIASDEMSSIQVLEEIERGKAYRTRAPVSLADEGIVRMVTDDEVELDLEGLATDQRAVYAIGSHSRVRSKVEHGDQSRTYSKNFRRLGRIDPRDTHNWVFRISLDGATNISAQAVTRTSLREAILRDSILQLFWRIPGKENGVDIEGITTFDGKLYAGFRSPVLRGNWVPVLIFEYGEFPRTRTRFVNLDGLGVRGMETVEDGLLLLAGPAGDADGEFRIFLWNGEDMLPGTGGPRAQLSCLAKIKPFPSGKPEGLARIGTEAAYWDVLIAFDGVEDQNRILGRFRVPRQPGSAVCD